MTDAPLGFDRCLATKNLIGTDTWSAEPGAGCKCAHCVRWRDIQIEELTVYKLTWERFLSLQHGDCTKMAEDAREVIGLRHHLETMRKMATPTDALVMKCAQYETALLEANANRFRWRPIATAPKDGTLILVWFKGFGANAVRWTDQGDDPTSEYALWHVDENKHGPYAMRGYNDGDDTHWMPLPTAPEGL